MNINQSCALPDGSRSTPCSNGLFTLFAADDFHALPDMTWMIDDILPCSGLASVYGPSGVGKSFICLDLAASVATGQPWFGHDTRACNVIYVALEGQAGFRRRVHAWSEFRGIRFPDNVKFLFDQFALNHADHPTGLASVIGQCGGAGLIIIDTLNKAAPGMDENSSTDMGKILAATSSIQEATNSLVLLVHHSGKDASRGLRGHSSLHAALDAVIEVQKDGQHIRFNLVKSKDGEDGISHSFKLVVVEIGLDKAGKSIKSCVVQEVEGGPVTKEAPQPRGVNQKIVLSAVQEILVKQRMQHLISETSQPDGLPYEEILSGIKDALIEIDPKHRQLRTKEELDSLLRQGYLSLTSNRVALLSQ